MSPFFCPLSASPVCERRSPCFLQSYTRHVQRLTALGLAVGILLQPLASAQVPQQGLEQRLAAVARQISAFQSEFIRIVGAEHATQVLRDNTRRTRTRLLLSDIFFVGADDSGRAMTVRTVRRVDGKQTPLAAGDVERALSLPAARRVEQLKALADAGARFNLGSLRRNFNDPTLGLLVLSGPYQSKFHYQDDGAEIRNDMTLHRLRFVERDRPTIIRDGRTGGDLPVSGRAWVDADGVTWRTELRVEGKDSVATLRVTYGRDEKLGVLVPRTMDEDYRYRDEGTGRLMFISGDVKYTDYRRFETQARILP